MPTGFALDPADGEVVVVLRGVRYHGRLMSFIHSEDTSTPQPAMIKLSAALTSVASNGTMAAVAQGLTDTARAVERMAPAYDPNPEPPNEDPEIPF
jgi:hypothetical protein